MTVQSTKIIRYPLKIRKLLIKKTVALNAYMKKITLTGSDLQDFETLAPDDNIKVIFPDESGILLLPEIGPEQEIIFNEPNTSHMRSYTVRHFDKEKLELEIECFLNQKGEGAKRALNAQSGQQVAIIGPKGSQILPSTVTHFLLMGDETAIPSIKRRLEEMTLDKYAEVILQVEEEGQELDFHTQARLVTKWLYRKELPSNSSKLLEQALRQIQLPKENYFIWIACEKQVALVLKDIALKELLCDPQSLKVSGYWKADHQ